MRSRPHRQPRRLPRPRPRRRRRATAAEPSHRPVARPENDGASMRELRPRPFLTLFTLAAIAALAACGPAAVESNQTTDGNGVAANVAKPTAEASADPAGLARYRED